MRLFIPPEWPSKTLRTVPSETFHSKIVLFVFSEAEARIVPSGVKARLLTLPISLSVDRSVPSDIRHIKISPSLDPDAKRVPSYLLTALQGEGELAIRTGFELH